MGEASADLRPQTRIGLKLENASVVGPRNLPSIVSVVNSLYQLVQHREVAEAVHVIGEARVTPTSSNASRKCRFLETSWA